MVVRSGGHREAVRDAHALWLDVADELTERCVLAADLRDIVHAYFIKPEDKRIFHVNFLKQ